VLNIPVEDVNCVIFFKIHFTRMVGRVCHGVLFMVYMECVKYTEETCNISLVEDRLDEIAMQSVII